ncbi:MAG: hypothetical protein KIT69_08520 [Propionibacteriaceae bacterium]|nr:hypothetical protein [Propionibacteriaceae bacterium]
MTAVPILAQPSQFAKTVRPERDHHPSNAHRHLSQPDKVDVFAPYSPVRVRLEIGRPQGG